MDEGEDSRVLPVRESREDFLSAEVDFRQDKSFHSRFDPFCRVCHVEGRQPL